MKARFIGDPNDDFSGPKVLRTADGAFPFGVFVPVTDEVALSLMTHSHFEVEEGDAEPYVAPPPPKLTAAQERALDGNDDGSAGGSLTKAETIARLEALRNSNPDVVFDPKWGLPKLRGVLEAAEFEAGDPD